MFKSLQDVKEYIEDTIKKHSKQFCTPEYSIKYSNRQRRALATTITSYKLTTPYKLEPYKLEFVFNNKYLESFKDNSEDIKDTVLHEIAHAIVGGRHHHDNVWKACCNKIGCRAERTRILNKKIEY